MNVDDYRKAYTAEIEKERQAQAASGRFIAMSASDRQPVDGDEDTIAKAIATFRDAAQSTETRLGALQDVQTALFSISHFDRYRSSFRDALRDVAATDNNRDLRVAALELLTMDKDELAKQLLLKGLDNAAEAIVPPAKAIQLLGHDDHGVAIPVARRIVSSDHDVETKAEALRVLASDPNSGPLFAEILSDRSQPPQLRSVSAAGLRQVNPQSFVQVAQNIIVNERERDDVRESTIGALKHLQGLSAQTNPAFKDALSKLDLSKKSDDFRAAVTSLLQAQTTK